MKRPDFINIRLFINAFIILTFAVLCTGCAQKPWQMEPSQVSSNSIEVLIISSGNFYGLLGHAGIKTEYGVFHFCAYEHNLIIEHMQMKDYLKLYNDYEQRDIFSIELDLTPEAKDGIWQDTMSYCSVPLPSCTQIFTYVKQLHLRYLAPIGSKYKNGTGRQEPSTTVARKLEEMGA